MPSDAASVPKKLGITVRRLREEAGLSQISLAEKAGLAHNFLGRVERGEAVASVETVVRIAAAFRMRGADLLTIAKL